MFRKINAFFEDRKSDVFVFLLIALVAIVAFGLGRLSVLYGGEGELKIIYPEGQESAAAAVLSEGGEYVASRSGKAYYYPWCGVAQRIKPENLLRFGTVEAAQKAGYRPGNCSGL